MSKKMMQLITIIVVLGSFCIISSNLQAQSVGYSWLNQVSLAKEKLEAVRLEHSERTVSYKQKTRLSRTKNKPGSRPRTVTRTAIRKHTDYAWKEIGLALGNLENDEIKLIKIRKSGRTLLTYNDEFNVYFEYKQNGLTWNGKNTAFWVRRNENPETGQKGKRFVVLANKWIERSGYGQPKTSIYVPFSSMLYQNELISSGETHLEDDIHFALSQLVRRGQGSLVFAQRSIASIVPNDYLRNIVLNEQTDPQEFYAFLDGLLEFNLDPFKRVLVIIAVNGEDAYSETRSNANALGPTQFTEKTWNLIRKEYPHAQLPNFMNGASDHVASLQATALLYDFNLARLVDAFSNKILEDKNLILYVAAAHNCGVGRVIQALKRTKPGRDWRIALRKLGKTNETIIFLEKMDYLFSQKP